VASACPSHCCGQHGSWKTPPRQPRRSVKFFNEQVRLPAMISRKPTGPLNGCPSGGPPLPAASERGTARQNTRADGTREKTPCLLYGYWCASGRHQGCQIEEAETSVHHRFMGSSESGNYLPALRVGGVPDVNHNSGPISFRLWMTALLTRDE
jgi:hypothetical protein